MKRITSIIASITIMLNTSFASLYMSAVKTSESGIKVTSEEQSEIQILPKTNKIDHWEVTDGNTVVVNNKFIMPAESVAIEAAYDTTGPQGTATISKTVTNESSVSVTAEATDDLSGIDKVVVNGYFVNGWTSNPKFKQYEMEYESITGKYEGSVNFAECPNEVTGETNQGDGEYQIVVWAFDKAGNRTKLFSSTCKYDTTNPQGTGTISKTETNQSSVSVTAEATDNLSGIDKVTVSGYFVNGWVSSPKFKQYEMEYNSTTGKYEGSVNFAECPNEVTGETNQGDGEYQIVVWAFDKAGNKAKLFSSTCEYDGTSPEGSATVDSVTDTAITFTASATDTGSGLMKVYVAGWWEQSVYANYGKFVTKTNPTNGEEYTFTLNFADLVSTVSGEKASTISDERTYYFSVMAFDNFGNRKQLLRYQYNKQASTYSVKYNGNGNTGGSTEGSSHTYGESDNLTANGFTKTGYVFKGWATSSSGSVKYADKASVTNLTTTNGGTVNLYAVWEANTYTVKYNGNGNTGGSTASSSHTYGQSKTLTANGFTKTGYVFKGWATSSSGSVKYADKASVTNLTTTNGGTVNLYAVWEQIKVTVNVSSIPTVNISASTNSSTFVTSGKDTTAGLVIRKGESITLTASLSGTTGYSWSAKANNTSDPDKGNSGAVTFSSTTTQSVTVTGTTPGNVKITVTSGGVSSSVDVFVYNVALRGNGDYDTYNTFHDKNQSNKNVVTKAMTYFAVEGSKSDASGLYLKIKEYKLGAGGSEPATGYTFINKYIVGYYNKSYSYNGQTTYSRDDSGWDTHHAWIYCQSW